MCNGMPYSHKMNSASSRIWTWDPKLGELTIRPTGHFSSLRQFICDAFTDYVKKNQNQNGIHYPCLTINQKKFSKHLIYHSLGLFSRGQMDDIFLVFPRKQDLTFHANCLCWRQFACNVKTCFMGTLVTIRMKCKNLFSGKNKQNISKCCLLKFLPRVLSVKKMYRKSNLNHCQE